MLDWLSNTGVKNNPRKLYLKFINNDKVAADCK